MDGIRDLADGLGFVTPGASNAPASRKADWRLQKRDATLSHRMPKSDQHTLVGLARLSHSLTVGRVAEMSVQSSTFTLRATSGGSKIEP